MKRSLAVALALATVAASHAIDFQITVTNIGVQPLSPVFFAAGNGNFDIFTSGVSASTAIELVAEEGDTSELEALGAAALGAGDVAAFGVLHAGAPIMPGETGTLTLTGVTSAHTWLSFASMLGVTNDAFIGSAIGANDLQINLFQGGEGLNADFVVSFLDVWDAGTEINDESAASVTALGATPGSGTPEGGFITRPHGGILGVGDIPLSMDWYGHNVARVQIQAVPEPASMAVLGLGALALIRRKRK